MPGWIWLLALVVGLTALQLLVYRRLRRESDQAPSAGRNRERSLQPGSHLAFEADAGEAKTPSGDRRRCPHCDAENDTDPVYTYCAVCLRRLQ